jgi:hypothetical protein
MKFKKILPTQSPLGWIIAAGVVAVAASPEARKKIRQLAVKGTAAVLGLTDEIRNKVQGLRAPGQQDKHVFDFSSFAGTGMKQPEQPDKKPQNEPDFFGTAAEEIKETEKPIIQTQISFSPDGELKMEQGKTDDPSADEAFKGEDTDEKREDQS